MLISSIFFSEVFDIISPIYKSGAMGHVFLYDIFGLSIGKTVLLITAIAILFIGFFNILVNQVKKHSGGYDDV